MRPRISIRGSVRPSVCPSVRPSVRPSFRPVLFLNDEKRHFWYSDDIQTQHGLKIHEKESFENTKCKKKDKNNPRKIFMTTSKINIQTTSNNEYQSSKCLMNKVNHASTSMTTTLTTTSTKTKTTIMIMTMINVIHRSIQSINQFNPSTNVIHWPILTIDQCQTMTNVIQWPMLSKV